MSDERPVDRTPAEQDVHDRFEATGWRTVTVEHRGPDATEVLALLVFYICPVCAAVVPVGEQGIDPPEEHRQYHLRMARWVAQAAR